MIVYKRSATSPVDLEVAPSRPAPELLPNLHIEVPNMWHAVFSSQKNTLTVEPLAEVSVSELSSQVKLMTSRLT